MSRWIITTIYIHNAYPSTYIHCTYIYIIYQRQNYTRTLLYSAYIIMYTKRRRRDSSDNRYNVRQIQRKRERERQKIVPCSTYTYYIIFIYNIVTVAVCYVTCPVNFLMNSSFWRPPPGTLKSWKKKYLAVYRQYRKWRGRRDGLSLMTISIYNMFTPANDRKCTVCYAYTHKYTSYNSIPRNIYVHYLLRLDLGFV